MKGSPTWPALAGAARYEFRMQIRRKTLWITFALFGLLTFPGSPNPWDYLPDDAPLSHVILDWADIIQTFTPIAFGCLLADRLPRDRRLGTADLLETLPVTPGGRLLGKYLGSALATLVPFLLIYSTGVACAVFDRGDLAAVPLALAAFVAVCLPGLLFVGAFSVAVPAVLWVPLYQFLFIGYWFWGNILGPYGSIPTISGTPLTPRGTYARDAFFDVEGLWLEEHAAWEGAMSVGLLLSLAALALYAAHRYLRWQEARR